MLGSNAIGVDINEEYLGYAISHYPNNWFVWGNVCDLPFTDNYIDVVVSFETIEHTTKYDDTLEEFRDVVKPGGKIFISTPNRRNYSDHFGLGKGWSVGHTQEWYPHEFKEILTSHGFEYECYCQNGSNITLGGEGQTQLYIIEVKK